MDLLPDTQQEAIARAARALIDQYDAPARAVALDPAAPPLAATFWKQAAEQGFLGLGLPEEAGGTDLGIAEETLVFRELGRGLVPGPFLGTVIAGHLAHHVGDLALAGRVVGGETAGLAETDASGVIRTQDAVGPGWWVVFVEGGAALYSGASVTLGATATAVDPAVRLADLRVSGEPLHTVAHDERDLRAHASVLVAAMLSGVCEATRDQSREFVQTRHQFDVPIGSFQSVKHRCADMAVRAEALTGLVTLAALSLTEDTADAGLLWPAVRALAGSYALTSAGDNIQNHGAIGYTAELSAHLFQKRAHALSQLLVTPSELRHAVLDAPATRTRTKER
jgi:alkylation response protein AidB-like acyl-CoA dehydrogenase